MSENMTSSRASAVLNLMEDLLGSPPTYDNFIKENCFRSGDEKWVYYFFVYFIVYIAFYLYYLNMEMILSFDFF